MSEVPDEPEGRSPAPSRDEFRYPGFAADVEAWFLRSSLPSDPVEHAARAAAARLRGVDARRVNADIDAALRGRSRSRSPIEPHRFIDPVSAGTLIVSVATLAWTVYNDLRSRSGKSSPDLVAREVRVKLRRPRDVDPSSYEEIITITVEETVNAASAALGSSSLPAAEPPSGDGSQP
jgi:hypothetical protein